MKTKIYKILKIGFLVIMLIWMFLNFSTIFTLGIELADNGLNNSAYIVDFGIRNSLIIFPFFLIYAIHEIYKSVTNK